MAQKIDRSILEQRIQEVEGLSSEERSALLELLHTKKYGLVWEDKPEDVEERLRKSLPVLIEDKELALAKGGENAPNHILIEGDNLEALTALTYTHEGKIDVIYIDPPYNTKNKDFVYNDKFVDYEDEYRHSKWLSFMSKRLRIAKRLLSDKGFIFISIDDNEQANLKLLCDDVFGEKNFIASPVRKRRESQANLSKNLSTIHEYVLIYKHCGEHILNKIKANINIKEYKNPDNDPRGVYKTMPCTNKGGTKYSVITPKGKIITDEWRFKKETYEALEKDNRIVFPCGGIGKPRYKLFLYEKESAGVISNSWWDELESNQKGASLLKEVFNGDEVFDNPKPVGLISFIESLSSSTESTILDFFAGSGTTLHATMQLNAVDGGKRQCILVTNNENNICRDVTYERNKRVINGYTTPKGVEVEGLKGNNLRYYRTEFVDRDSSMTNKRKLMAAATELLNIKQDIYKEVHTFGSLKLRSHIARYFAERGKQMLIIYKVEAIEYLVKEIAQMPADTHILIYVFSINNYAMDADFEDVADKVTLCALPAAIYNAYLKVLPKKKADVAVEESEEKSNEEPLLFTEEDEQ